MAMDAKEIVELIQTSFPDARISIQDLKGDGDHYAILVESALFEGMSRIQQHQRVYQALQGRVGEQLHALSVTTRVLSSK